MDRLSIFVVRDVLSNHSLQQSIGAGCCMCVNSAATLDFEIFGSRRSSVAIASRSFDASSGLFNVN